MNGLTIRSESLLYDLHSHTQASDGLLTPTELVQRAVEMGVNVLAITDHDTVSGLAEAHLAIEQLALPLRLINGIEISTSWHGFDIHIVGLNIDPQSASLEALLADQLQQRQQRANEIAAKLAKKGIPEALQGALKYANGEVLSRAHFAHYLVEIGIENDISRVFKKYLSKGKTAYVEPKSCHIAQAVNAIHQADGTAVVAHPGRYGLSAKWLRKLLEEFKSVGGDAIEIAQCQQGRDERAQLLRYAKELDFSASQGSDFHYPCEWTELGRGLWLPEGVEPVWLSWQKN